LWTQCICEFELYKCHCYDYYYHTTVGTMSGGGGRVMKGKMSSTIIEEIDEKAMHNLEKQLEQVTMT